MECWRPLVTSKDLQERPLIGACRSFEVEDLHWRGSPARSPLVKTSSWIPMEVSTVGFHRRDSMDRDIYRTAKFSTNNFFGTHCRLHLIDGQLFVLMDRYLLYSAVRHCAFAHKRRLHSLRSRMSRYPHAKLLLRHSLFCASVTETRVKRSWFSA